MRQNEVFLEIVCVIWIYMNGENFFNDENSTEHSYTLALYIISWMLTVQNVKQK